MPTTITKKVGDAVGVDYAEVDDFLSALANDQDGLSADLVASDTIVVVEIHGTAVSSTSSTFGGAHWISVTTDSTHFVHFKPGSGYEHRGDWRFGATITSASPYFLTENRAPYVYYEELIFIDTEDVGLRIWGVDNIVFNRCIFLAKRTGSSTSYSASLVNIANESNPQVPGGPIPGIADALFISCLFIGDQTFGGDAGALSVEVAYSSGFNASAMLLNTTIMNFGGPGIVGVDAAPGSVTVNAFNLLMLDIDGTEFHKLAGTPIIYAGGASNDAYTDDGSALALVLSDDVVVSYDDNLEDPNVITTSPTIGLGSDITGFIPSWLPNYEDRDINGNLRDGITWDLGCMQQLNTVTQPIAYTDAPLKARKHDRGEDYDEHPRLEWSRMLIKIDRILSRDNDRNTDDIASIDATQDLILVNRDNPIYNAAFDYWQQGTSFSSAIRTMTADLWKKGEATKVERGPARGTSTYSMRVSGLSGGVVAWVHYFLPVAGFLAGGSVTLGCGVLCSVAGVARIGITSDSFEEAPVEDSSSFPSFSYSSYHSGGGGEEALIATRSIASTDTWIVVRLELNLPSSSSVTADFFEVMLARGSFSSLTFVSPDPQKELSAVLRHYQKYSSFFLPTGNMKSTTSLRGGSTGVVGVPSDVVGIGSSSVPSGVSCVTTNSEPIGALTQVMQIGSDYWGEGDHSIMNFRVQPSVNLVVTDSTEWKNITFEQIPNPLDF